nr:HNH endonuclease [Salinicola sp. CPA57]
MKAPLCAFCLKRGIYTQARIVDHITRHRGDTELFSDPDNLQSLCKRCHDSTKQRLEKRDVQAFGFDADGFPLDPDSHWN